MNHKCVDYFRIVYTKSDKSGVTQVTSDRIDRNASDYRGSMHPLHFPVNLSTLGNCSINFISGLLAMRNSTGQGDGLK